MKIILGTYESIMQLNKCFSNVYMYMYKYYRICILHVGVCIYILCTRDELISKVKEWRTHGSKWWLPGAGNQEDSVWDEGRW